MSGQHSHFSDEETFRRDPNQGISLHYTGSVEKQIIGKAETTGRMEPRCVGCWEIVSGLNTPFGNAEEVISSSFCLITDVGFTQQILRMIGL